MEGGYCDAGVPNPPCQGSASADAEVMSARSRHQGGVHAALADGSVRFITNTIVWSTWQALGTAQGNDTVGSY